MGPMLPLKALRRPRQAAKEAEEDDDKKPQTGHRRPGATSRGITLSISPPTPSNEEAAGTAKHRTLSQPADGQTPSARAGPTSPIYSPAGLLMTSPVGARYIVSPHARRASVPRAVHFAPSPTNTYVEVTPYNRVYGVHPAMFDFGQSGEMQPTPQGAYEMQYGRLQLTPTAKGRMAIVVQGTSPTSSPTGAQVMQMPFAVGESCLVNTDDGLQWMEAQVIAVYPQAAQAEGYSIPAGTVKVSYDLGIKWVMPQNMATTLRKKAQAFQPPARALFGAGAVGMRVC